MFREKITIIMSTYNGHKYIKEQLKSILDQMSYIDEVIIKDDCSLDNTVNIIKSFIEDNKCKNWKLLMNESNVGWKRNFTELVELATGDYIFFCDQDDVWEIDKVRKMIDIMSKNRDILVLATDYSIIIENNEKSYIKKNNISNIKLEKFETKLNPLYTLYPGCTYCIRSEMKDYYIKYWNNKIPHDAFAWHVANYMGRLYIMHEKLIKYRRHSETVTGRNISNFNQRIEDIVYYNDLIKLYMKLEKTGLKGNVDLKNVIIWNKNRLLILKKIDIKALIQNLKYINYYWSIKTYFADIYYAWKR